MMDIEDFLQLRSGDILYNETSSQIGKVCDISADYKIDQIPSLVYSVLDNGGELIYYIVCSHIVRANSTSLNSFEHMTVNVRDRDNWQKIESICTIQDQVLVNRILLFELQMLRDKLMGNVTVVKLPQMTVNSAGVIPEQILSLPPQYYPGIYI